MDATFHAGSSSNATGASVHDISWIYNPIDARATATRAATAGRNHLMPRAEEEGNKEELELEEEKEDDGQATTAVLGLDGTPYEVTHGPGATVGDLWPLLQATHGLAPVHYRLHGLRHLRLAQKVSLAGKLAELPEPMQHLIGRFASAPLDQAARVADYNQLHIVARTPLATTFGDGRGDIECDGSTATAVWHDGRYGRARLGPWGPRAGALRARLRLEQGDGVIIGLVREEAWAGGRGLSWLGWSYSLQTGALYDNSCEWVGRDIPPMRCPGGVVEVELRDGALRYTVDGAAQGAVFQIPAEGDRVGLAVGLGPPHDRVTLLDH